MNMTWTFPIDFRKKHYKKLLEFKKGSRDEVRKAWQVHYKRLKARIDNRQFELSLERVKEFIKQRNEPLNSYTKILIPGNKHIYLASPFYRHRDYNKSIFCDNTTENRKYCEWLNDTILGIWGEFTKL